MLLKAYMGKALIGSVHTANVLGMAAEKKLKVQQSSSPRPRAIPMTLTA